MSQAVRFRIEFAIRQRRFTLDDGRRMGGTGHLKLKLRIQGLQLADFRRRIVPLD